MHRLTQVPQPQENWSNSTGYCSFRSQDLQCPCWEKVHWHVKDNILAGFLLLLQSRRLSASTKGPSEDKTTVLFIRKQFFRFSC